MGEIIRIHLDDGTTSGVRYIELAGWSGKAFVSSRMRIKSLVAEKEVQKPGVYFLFGVDEESGKDAVYIGEADDVANRLPQHLGKTWEWNEVVLFTDEQLNKAGVRYLESRLIQLAREANKYAVQNKKSSRPFHLGRGEAEAMDKFVSNIKLLLSVLGYKVLEPSRETDRGELLRLFLEVKGIRAEARRTDEGIVVVQGSQASTQFTDSLSPGYRELRERLIHDGVLKKRGEMYEFTQDYVFKSPSQAAAIIVGYSINGREQWKTKDGKSLKDLEENT